MLLLPLPREEGHALERSLLYMNWRLLARLVAPVSKPAPAKIACSKFGCDWRAGFETGATELAFCVINEVIYEYHGISPNIRHVPFGLTQNNQKIKRNRSTVDCG